MADDPRASRPSGALALYEEYQQGTTPEARLVKACDKLQLMLKVAVYERWGTGALGEFWDNPDNFPDGGFPAGPGAVRGAAGAAERRAASSRLVSGILQSGSPRRGIRRFSAVVERSSPSSDWRRSR